MFAALALGVWAGCGEAGDTSDPTNSEAISFASGPPGDRATLYAVGDGANGSADAAAVVELIDEAEIDRFLYLGDVYDEGTAAEFQDNYDPIYGQLRDRTSPTPGNHEWPNRDQGYDPYWDPPGDPSTPPYYSFEIAGWELISLNSEMAHGAGSSQVKWLRSRLGEGGTCRLAFWHQPRFSAGTYHGDQPSLEPFWAALRGKAVLVLNGHEHNYQRMKPVAGITQLIAGGGGTSLYPVDDGDERLAASWDRGDSVLRIELMPGRATFELLRVGRPPLEQRSVRCEQLSDPRRRGA